MDIRQEMEARKVCVVVPTYNNGRTVADVVRRIAAITPQIIVVIDGCTDDTREQLAQLKEIPLTLVDYAQNRGKGHALVAGFRKAKEMGYDYAITIDSDGQHFPEDIPQFIEALQQHPGALIIGARNLQEKNMPGGNTFANKFSNFWFTAQTFKRLPDTQTGYRLYPLHKLSGTRLITSRYEAELELLVFAAWRGVELVSVPVRLKRFTYSLFALLFFLGGMYLFLLPYTWVYFHLFKETEERKLKYHKMLRGVADFVIHHVPGVRFHLDNSIGETFEKPAVVISNHQAHLDLMCLMMLTPRIIFLTNDWVWNNPFYGMVIHKAEFYPVSDGIENHVDRLRDLYERGYSICVFPEGTRSEDCRILRFHKGAFYLAEQLQAEILPVFLHGVGRVLPKREFRLHKGDIHVEVGARIPLDDARFSQDLLERTRQMRHMYQTHYHELCLRYDTTK